jgi:ribonuclease HI
MPSTSVVYKTLGIFNTHSTTQTVHTICRLQTPILEGTPVGWFDGVASSSGLQSGVGGILKISDNTLYKWTFNTGPGSNNRAELLGVWETLLLATRLHISELQVVGDSKIIIDWCKGKGRLQIISLDCWKIKIKELSTHFRAITFTHTYREFNKEADDLSKKALKEQIGKIYFTQWEEGYKGPTRCLKIF